MSLIRTAGRSVAITLAIALAAGGGLLVTVPANAVEGGAAASTQTFPWAVALKPTLVPLSFCGGVLVTPTKVVTAGHCVEPFLAVPSLLHVVAGRDKMSTKDGTEVAVRRVWRHPGYSTFTFHGETGYRNDIAVLTLSSALPFGTLRVAAPDQTGLYQPGTVARILGWGTTAETKLDGGVLRTATVPVISDGQCGDPASYGATYDTGQYTCAGDFDQGGVDTCQFDSGTPLVIDGVVAGITSWGVGCGRPHFPGLYTRVTTFSNEISAQLAS
jgi:secreted trypsin-like serine protease